MNQFYKLDSDNSISCESGSTSNNNIPGYIKRILIMSGITGLLSSILFYKQHGGLSFPLFTIANFVLILHLHTHITGKTVSTVFRDPWIVISMLTTILISFCYFTNTNGIMDFFNFWFILGMLCVFLYSLNHPGRGFFSGIVCIENFFRMFFIPLGSIVKPFKYTATLVRKSTREKKEHTEAKKVLIGVMISLPLLLILVGLLSSADMIFENYVKEIGAVFKNLKIDFIMDPVRFIVLAVVMGACFFACMYTLLVGKKLFRERENTVTGKKYDSIVYLTVLSLVLVLYVFFCILQFSYLFAGGKNALPEGLSYSQYARSGFFELLAVSVINFAIILLGVFKIEGKNKLQSSLVKAGMLLLIIVTGIMLYSSYFRMRLYQLEFGYTRLRVIVFFSLLAEFILLTVTAAYIFKPRFNLINAGFFIIIGIYVCLNFFNMDAFIAGKNIERYMETQKIDQKYLTRLSMDSIPEIMPLIQKEGLENLTDDLKQYLRRSHETIRQHTGWQEFNLSEYRVRKLLDELFTPSAPF